MSDQMPTRRGKAPRTDAEWAREIQRRVATLESASSVRVGDWVLNARDGDLIATTPGSEIVLSDPILATTAVFSGGSGSGGGSALELILQAIEEATGLVITEGPEAFFTSLIELLTSGTGLDFSSPLAFVASIIELIIEALGNIGMTLEQLIQMIAEATGLDFSSPLAFLGSLINLLITNIGAFFEALINNAQALWEALWAAFPIDFCNGPQAFIDSIVSILQTIGADIQLMVDTLLNLALELFGLDFSSLPAFFASVFDNLVEFIQQSVINIGNVFEAIAQVLGFPGLVSGIGEGLEDFVLWVQQTVFGFIDPNRLPIIPISHIGDTSVNLLSNPYFADAAIIDPTGMWTVDPAVTHYPIGGSATVACSDAVHELLSVDLIGVSKGQKLDVSAWMKMLNVVGDGPNGITLGVRTFTTIDGSGKGTDIDLATVSTYGTRDWQKLSGTYTVPDTGGVTTLRVRIAVNEKVNSGRVWFDEMWCSKQGLLPMNLVQDLTNTIDTITADINKFLGELAKFLKLDEWKKFLSDITGVANATVANVVTMLQYLTETGMFQVAGLLGLIPMEQVDGPGAFPNIGAAVSQALGDFQMMLDEFLSALTGKPVTPNSATTGLTAEQIGELLATTTANASALAAIQAATQGGLTNMVASGDDFERDALNPVPAVPLWQEYASASTATNGGFTLQKGQMVWVDRGNQANLVRYRRTNAADRNTVTPYQRVTRVNGTVVAEPSLPLILPGVDFLYARVSDDFTKYLYVAYDGDGRVTLGYSVSGVAGEQVLKTVQASKPTAGSTYAIECGDPGDLRSYRVLRNNSTVLAFEDTTGKTAQLDTLRGWGWGGRANPRALGQSTPSSIHSIVVADIPPEPTIGSFLHAVRRSTNRVTKNTGDQLLPLNTFDDLVRNSPDVTMDLRSGIFLLAKPGPYVVTCRLDTGTFLGLGEEWEMLLYEYVGGKTPMLRQRGGQEGGPAIASSAATVLGGTFQFYAQGINSQWAVGFSSSAVEGVVGNQNGDTTYLTVTRGM